MWEDPIVAEVHRAREKLAAESNFDVTAFFAGIRKRQASLGGRLIPQEKRAEPMAESDRDRHSGSPAAQSSEAPPSSEAAPAA